MDPGPPLNMLYTVEGYFKLLISCLRLLSAGITNVITILSVLSAGNGIQDMLGKLLTKLHLRTGSHFVPEAGLKSKAILLPQTADVSNHAWCVVWGVCVDVESGTYVVRLVFRTYCQRMTFDF